MTIYKRLGPKDLATLRSLNEVLGKAFNELETHLSKVPSDDYLLKLLSKETIIILAAIKGTEVVGGLVAYALEKYEQERSEVYVYDLAVDEQHRRQGIARNLILNLKPIAKSLGAWIIFIQADPQDIPAIKLYESMGEKEFPLHFDISVD